MIKIFKIPVALAEAVSDQIVGTTAQTQVSATDGISEYFLEILKRLPYWIGAIAVLFLAIFFARVVASSVTNAITAARGDDVPRGRIILVRRAIYVTLFSVGLLLALEIGNIIDIGWLLGAIGLGVGFALKDLINNFISGIIILINNELHIGDMIEVTDVKGTIVDIQARATIVQKFDGTKVTIPNGLILSTNVISYTSNPFRRIEIPVGISFKSDIDKAKMVALDVLKNHSRIEETPSPYVIVTDLADSAVMLSVRGWIKSKGVSWLRVKSELIRDVKLGFDKNGIEIPFPIITLDK